MINHQPSNQYALLADIGGTNARFALSDGKTILQILQYRCEDYETPADAVRCCLHEMGNITVSSACFAVATPVLGDDIRMTNSPWEFSARALREEFNWQRFRVINDFTAMALSVPLLASNEQQQVSAGEPVIGSPIAVIGPGTGLGVGGLIPVSDSEYTALSGEGGHVTASPLDARQALVFNHLKAELGHVSAERLVSGQGLENVYSSLCAIDTISQNIHAAADIAAAAAEGDSLAAEAVEIFCQQLGCVAGNLALTLGATGGVYLGGGILAKLGTLFTESGFTRRYSEKGRFDTFLKSTPCYLMMADNPALRGCQYALSSETLFTGLDLKD